MSDNKIDVIEENMRFFERISKRKSYSKMFPEASGLLYETQDLHSKITSRIIQILADERIAYKTAKIQTNAPLAMIQLQMETELHTLQKILGIDPTDIKMIRGEK